MIQKRARKTRAPFFHPNRLGIFASFLLTLRPGYERSDEGVFRPPLLGFALTQIDTVDRYQPLIIPLSINGTRNHPDGHPSDVMTANLENSAL